MAHFAQTFSVNTPGPGPTEITAEIAKLVEKARIEIGLVTLFCRHTSASLTINENAAPAVQRDLVDWLDRLAPESPLYEHDSEGSDDMPAHLKCALTGVSLSIPVQDWTLALGTWQGIFLLEHRDRPHRREIAVHIAGE